MSVVRGERARIENPTIATIALSAEGHAGTNVGWDEGVQDGRDDVGAGYGQALALGRTGAEPQSLSGGDKQLGVLARARPGRLRRRKAYWRRTPFRRWSWRRPPLPGLPHERQSRAQRDACSSVGALTNFAYDDLHHAVLEAPRTSIEAGQEGLRLQVCMCLLFHT